MDVRERRASITLLAALVTACSGAHERAPTFDARTYLDAHARTLDEVVEATRFAFHEEGDAFVSGPVVASDDGVRIAIEGDEVTIGRARVGAERCAATRLLDDGALACAATYGEEHVRARASGVEQGWWVARPPGHGALTWDVPITGATLGPRVDGGVRVRFGEQSYRYGDARAVDARGRVLVLEGQPTAEGVRFSIDEDALDELSFPLVVDPTFGPEIPIDTPTPYLPFRPPSSFAMTSDGTTFYVVWITQATAAASPDLWGARVQRDGTVLDGTGVRLTNTPSENESSIAITQVDGTLYVAYARSTPTAGVLVRRYDTAWNALDAAPHVIDTGTDVGRELRITASGSALLVSWLVRGFGAVIQTLRARPIASDGSPLGAGTVTLVTAPTTGTTLDTPRVAGNGTDFLLAWEQVAGFSMPRIVYAQRVAANGTAVGSPVAVEPMTVSPLSTAYGAHDVVWDGTQWVVASVHAGVVGLSRISPAGTLVDPTPVGLGDVRGGLPLLARVGGDVVVACGALDAAGQNEVHQIVATTTGASITARTPSLWLRGGGAAQALALASDTLMFVYQGGSASSLLGSRASAGAVLDPTPFPVQRGFDWQFEPGSAWSGSSYVVTWRDMRAPAQGLFAIALAPDGTPRSAIGTHVADPATSDPGPRVLAIRGGAILMWNDYDGAPVTYAQRLDADAALVGSRIDVPRNGGLFASDGTTLATVGASGGMVEATIYDLDFAPIVGPFQVPSISGAFSIEGEDGMYLVVARYAATGRMDAVRFDTSGRVLDTPPLVLGPTSDITTTANIAIGTDEFIVVWNTSSGLTSSRVRRTGTYDMPARLALGTELTLADGNGHHGACFDGTDTLVLGVTGTTAIGATWISEADGTALPATNIATNVYSGGQLGARLGTCASDRSGGAIALYTTYDETIASARLRARAYARSGGTGHACTSAAECDNGLCVDGVCCDAPCGGVSTTDCQACAIAAGASRDGHCTLLDVTHTCRARASVCDRAETCSGASTACPADTSLPDGTSCSDGAACNGEEACRAGACAPGTPLVCDDGDACSDDLCVEPTGCTAIARPACCASAVDCDDGHACTIDTCGSDGACGHARVAGCCESGADCDDGNACTSDGCSASACSHSPIDGCCASDLDCDDGDACTLDRCESHTCAHEGACDAGDGRDAATTPDAASPDAAIAADAATVSPPATTGCGCRAGTSGAGGAVWIAIGLILIGRRRALGLALFGLACSAPASPPDASTPVDAAVITDAARAPDALGSMDASLLPDAYAATDAYSVPDTDAAPDAFASPDAYEPPDASPSPDAYLCAPEATLGAIQTVAVVPSIVAIDGTRVASDGTHVAVVFEAESGPTRNLKTLHFVLLDRDGVPVPGTETQLAALGLAPDVAWNGSEYGVAWLERGIPTATTSTPRFQTFGADGLPSSAPTTLPGGWRNTQTALSLTWAPVSGWAVVTLGPARMGCTAFATDVVAAYLGTDPTTFVGPTKQVACNGEALGVARIASNDLSIAWGDEALLPSFRVATMNRSNIVSAPLELGHVVTTDIGYVFDGTTTVLAGVRQIESGSGRAIDVYRGDALSSVATIGSGLAMGQIGIAAGPRWTLVSFDVDVDDTGERDTRLFFVPTPETASEPLGAGRTLDISAPRDAYPVAATAVVQVDATRAIVLWTHGTSLRARPVDLVGCP